MRLEAERRAEEDAILEAEGLRKSYVES